MRNHFDLNGKVALVTGASSGIGRATAVALAGCGASVAVNFHRNESGAEAARAEVVNAGVRATVIQADVTRSAEVKALVARVVEELGPVDILVNNAGSLVERLKILELSEERWDEVLDLNLKSAFLCSQAVAASMMERRAGAIVNVSSIAGRDGTPEEVASLITFLASDAASYLCGETIEINGGMLML